MRFVSHLAGAVFILASCWGPAWAQERLGGEFQVNTYTTDGQNRPVVASGGGTFVVVWDSLGQDGDSYGIFGRRFTVGGASLGDDFQVNTYTTGSQSVKSVAVDPGGNFVVVWHSDGVDGSVDGVLAQRFDSTGDPAGGELPVNTHTTSNQKNAAVGMAADGSFVVAWESQNQEAGGGGTGIFGQRFDSMGVKAGDEFHVNTYTTSTQFLPELAMGADGSFVVVWESVTQDGSDSGVFGQTFDGNGDAVGGELPVNSYTTGQQRRPAVAMDADGDFVVVWQSKYQDGSDYGIFGQRYASDGAPQGSEFQVNSYTTGTQRIPSVAMDAAGNFIVAWSGSGPEATSAIFARRFASDGAPLGTEFVVNTSPSTGVVSSVAMDRNGDFVVVWPSFDGSYSGIVGQRLRFPELSFFIGAPDEEPGPAADLPDGSSNGADPGR